ncbi:sigma-70 family RNA polymerase sigma factor [bacterium]|nr:sigma-70 family RNA polymerase sigma factor [bacterium]
MLQNQSNSGGEFPDSDVTQRLRPTEVESLYHQYSQRLTAYLIGVLKDADRAAEALQNTFQRVLESGHTAQQASFQGWIYKVAFHEAMALKRKIAIDQRAQQNYSVLQALKEVDGSGQAAHESQLTTREETEKLRVALSQLPIEQQVVVQRRIYHEQTFAVIATELNVPLGTVLTRMRLALQKLEKLLAAPQ